MEHVVKIEVTLAGDAARLYEILSEATESVKPGQVNRAVLETGIVHHVLMLTAMGLIPEAQREEARRLIERIGERTIMKDLFAHAQNYWEQLSDAGTIEPEE